MSKKTPSRGLDPDPTLYSRVQETFFISGQRVSVLGLVGSMVCLSHAVLCLLGRSRQRQHVNERAWLRPHKALVKKTGSG